MQRFLEGGLAGLADRSHTRRPPAGARSGGDGVSAMTPTGDPSRHGGCQSVNNQLGLTLRAAPGRFSVKQGS